MSLAAAEFATLRLRLLKVAARIIESASRIRVAFTSACPDASVFRAIATTLPPAPAYQRGSAADPKATSSNLEKPIAQVAVKTPPMTRDCIMPPANNQTRSDRNSDLMNKTG
jgi:hypothetical protein